MKSRRPHSLMISEGDLRRELWLLIALLPDPLRFYVASIAAEGAGHGLVGYC